MFCVSVPVLSEQMQDVEPSVSTPAWIDHDEGVAAARRRLDAIFMNASSLPRRDGPDVFQRLKFEQGTTHVIDGVRRDAESRTLQIFNHDLLRVHPFGGQCETDRHGSQ